MPAARSRQTSSKTTETKKIDRNVEYGEKEDGSLSGNITMEPELRFTPSGRAVVTVNVAVSDRVQLEDGSWENTETEFYRVNVWGNQAENVAEYLSKGNRVVMTGYFQDRTFTNNNGERVTKTEFTATDIGPSLLFNGAKIIKAERNAK